VVKEIVMRLGFDIDEVVVDLTNKMVAYVKDRYGIEISKEIFRDYCLDNCKIVDDEAFDKDIKKEMLRLFNDPDFSTRLNLLLVLKSVYVSLKEQGHKLYYITKRPKQNQPSTFKWFRKNGIPFDDLLLLGKDSEKGPFGVKLRLDMFVDDLELHLNSLWSYKKNWAKGLLLMDRPWNNTSVDGSKFIRVHTWDDIHRHVCVHKL
jgi:uncharacterized protein